MLCCIIASYLKIPSFSDSEIWYQGHIVCPNCQTSCTLPIGFLDVLETYFLSAILVAILEVSLLEIAATRDVPAMRNQRIASDDLEGEDESGSDRTFPIDGRNHVSGQADDMRGEKEDGGESGEDGPQKPVGFWHRSLGKTRMKVFGLWAGTRALEPGIDRFDHSTDRKQLSFYPDSSSRSSPCTGASSSTWGITSTPSSSTSSTSRLNPLR